MKVEVDVELLRDTVSFLEAQVGDQEMSGAFIGAFRALIDERERRAAAERDAEVRVALDAVANVLMALRPVYQTHGEAHTWAQEERERALRQIHNITAGVLGEANDNDVPELINAAGDELVVANAYLARVEDEDAYEARSYVGLAIDWLAKAGYITPEEEEAGAPDRMAPGPEDRAGSDDDARPA